MWGGRKRSWRRTQSWRRETSPLQMRRWLWQPWRWAIINVSWEDWVDFKQITIGFIIQSSQSLQFRCLRKGHLMRSYSTWLADTRHRGSWGDGHRTEEWRSSKAWLPCWASSSRRTPILTRTRRRPQRRGRGPRGQGGCSGLWLGTQRLPRSPPPWTLDGGGGNYPYNSVFTSAVILSILEHHYLQLNYGESENEAGAHFQQMHALPPPNTLKCQERS